MQHPIPDVALDGRIAIVGLAGSGKSTTAKGGVEILLRRGQRVCVVDLTDSWWGLRLERDGRTPAFNVAILGGAHADLPLNEHAGAVVGEAIAKSAGSTVLSLSEFDSDAARRRFALAFFDALHRHNRAPLHLILDEADFYAPQNPVKDGPGPLLLNRVKEIASRGRIRGFRLWPITQRPAKLHKDVLSQAETLIAMKLTASQDRNAIKAWISDQADEGAGKAILATLPQLKRGQGVLWSPGANILEPAFFPLPGTFDSSATPLHNDDAARIDLGTIDLRELGAALSTVERDAKANDPKALRAEISRLKGEMTRAAALAAQTGARPDPQALADAEHRGYARGKVEGYADALKLGEPLVTKLRQIAATAGELAQGIEQWSHRKPAPVPSPRPVASAVAPRPAPAPRAAAAPGGPLSKAERLVLTALAQHPGGCTKAKVAILAGYAVTGGGFNNALSSLRSRGMMEGSGDRLVITAAGMNTLGTYDPLPTGAALLDHWLAQLGKAEREALRAVAAAWPNALSKEDVAAQAGYEASGGGFNNALSRLRTLELINGRGDIKASDDLFG